MPLGFRIATVYFQLTASSQDTLGRLIYAEFLRKGVRGMPDIRGKSAEQYVQEMGDKINSPQLADKLPGDYGRSFGARAYGLLIKNVGVSDADDVVANFMRRYFEGSGRGMEEGIPLAKAEAYVLNGIWKEALNLLKVRKRERSRYESITREDEGEERTLDIRDPRFMDKIEAEFPVHELVRDPFVQRELRQIHPDAPLYVELMLEGYSNEEIVGVPVRGQESMLPHLKERPMSPQNWHKTQLPKIYQVLKDRAQEAS